MDCCVTPLRHGGLSLVQTTDFFYPLVDDPYMQVTSSIGYFRCQIFTEHIKFILFYSTGCRGIVFTHGVWMGGRAAGKVCPACISGIVRCRNLIRGRDIG